MKTKFSLYLFIATLFFSQPLLAEKIGVVCTTGMIGDLAKAIVKDKGEVTVLMGAGVDPHLYKPTRSDIARLGKADIIFYNGLLLEGKMTDALIRVARSGKSVIAVTEEIDKSELLEPESFAGHFDPHVWMDPTLWRQVGELVVRELGNYRPALKAEFEGNFLEYQSELDRLIEYSSKAVASVPAEKRILVTAHDAFNYFGKRYGFEVHGIQGLSTESEAGIRHIEDLVSLLVAKQIKAVFIESTVPSRSVHALIEGASRKDHKVTIGGELYSDAMGSEGTYEGTYIGMIDHNVTKIISALGGSVESKGMTGKLAADE